MTLHFKIFYSKTLFETLPETLFEHVTMYNTHFSKKKKRAMKWKLSRTEKVNKTELEFFLRHTHKNVFRVFLNGYFFVYVSRILTLYDSEKDIILILHTRLHTRYPYERSEGLNEIL